MHEASVMRTVLVSILDQLKDNPDAKVVEVILVIGEMTFLGHEQLAFAFEVMTKDTPVEGAKLELKVENTKVKCSKCTFEGEPKKVEFDDAQLAHTMVASFTCPECSSAVDIIEGKDLVLQRVVLEVEE